MVKFFLAEVALPRSEWAAYDPEPSYFDLFQAIYNTFTYEWVSRRSSDWAIVTFAKDIQESFALTRYDLFGILFVAAVLTILRSCLSKWVFQPLAQHLQLREADSVKLPECMFKALYYSCSFSFSCYILFGTGDNYFGDPSFFWQEWRRSMPVSWYIQSLYTLQLGFYIHAVYGVLFLDARRKDTLVMVLHHIITLLLMIFSLGVRFHRIGVVVLFMHDIADIFLEFGKLAMSLRYRGGKFDKITDFISTMCFVGFMLSWLIFRLIIYIRYVLYVTGHLSMLVVPRGPFYIFFNCLLGALYIMNVYWFQFIVLAAIKILSGSGVLEDTREESSQEEANPVPKKEEVTAVTAKKEEGDEHTQMGLQRILKLPENKAPPEFAENDCQDETDVDQMSPGQSASQTVNRRLRRRQS